MLTALHSKLNIKVISRTKNRVTDCIPSYALYKLTNYFSYCCDCFQRLEKPSDTQQWRRSTEVSWREQVPGDESSTSCCARLFSTSPTPLLFHPQKRDNGSFQRHNLPGLSQSSYRSHLRNRLSPLNASRLTSRVISK